MRLFPMFLKNKKNEIVKFSFEESKLILYITGLQFMQNLFTLSLPLLSIFAIMSYTWDRSLVRPFFYKTK